MGVGWISVMSYRRRVVAERHLSCCCPMAGLFVLVHRGKDENLAVTPWLRRKAGRRTLAMDDIVL